MVQRSGSGSNFRINKASKESFNQKFVLDSPRETTYLCFGGRDSVFTCLLFNGYPLIQYLFVLLPSCYSGLISQKIPFEIKSRHIIEIDFQSLTSKYWLKITFINNLLLFLNLQCCNSCWYFRQFLRFQLSRYKSYKSF